MNIAQLIAQLVAIGIAALEGVMKAHEIAAREGLTEEEKEALIQADIAGMQARLAAASARVQAASAGVKKT